ncbi:uncharacterized protein CIMG_02335 [Coccidioides immitis RS]|uniref:Uncharacterized protein n=1 Tax=Coccidioides immitis (strain RS) TaxID=246410 RepID=J3KL53_COCIM|nr:uncharacterized protein CIMG_02335 [Coccidioides immitis RS]EAS36981.3 hypothetical protein CIMG_02335 [Coccidioides immitis RS]
MGSIRGDVSERGSRVARGDETSSQDFSTRPEVTSPAQQARSEDSWIEVASQPSSSSLSSATANDEIVTTGLRVQQHRTGRGVRHPIVPQDLDITYSHRQPMVNESSQEEYEETESESDRVMSSSNEDISRPPRPALAFIPGNPSTSDVALSSDEDDSSTALGLNPPAFTPQPNVFSHPPTSQTSARPHSNFPASGYGPGPMDNRARSRRNSRASLHSARRTRTHQQQHSPYNMYSPSHHVDHDAALRASLSTLLSCAAAARGLPKRDNQCSAPERSNATRSSDPPTFRLVPESVAMRDDDSDQNNTTLKEPQFRTPPPPPSKRSRSPLKSTNKARRKSSPSKDHSAAQPLPKKARRTAVTETGSLLGPTVMTWVISAGVVVLFSAISFSAGYVLGREVGRTEAGQGLYANGNGLSGARTGAGCGKDAVKGGLRQFRWVRGGSGSGIAA